MRISLEIGFRVHPNAILQLDLLLFIIEGYHDLNLILFFFPCKTFRLGLSCSQSCQYYVGMCNYLFIERVPIT